jgi:hypothetical protein
MDGKGTNVGGVGDRPDPVRPATQNVLQGLPRSRRRWPTSQLGHGRSRRHLRATDTSAAASSSTPTSGAGGAVVIEDNGVGIFPDDPTCGTGDLPDPVVQSARRHAARLDALPSEASRRRPKPAEPAKSVAEDRGRASWDLARAVDGGEAGTDRRGQPSPRPRRRRGRRCTARPALGPRHDIARAPSPAVRQQHGHRRPAWSAAAVAATLSAPTRSVVPKPRSARTSVTTCAAGLGWSWALATTTSCPKASTL